MKRRILALALTFAMLAALYVPGAMAVTEDSAQETSAQESATIAPPTATPEETEPSAEPSAEPTETPTGTPTGTPEPSTSPSAAPSTTPQPSPSTSPEGCTCGTLNGEHQEGCPLYYENMDVADLYALLMDASEEEAEEILNKISQEKYQALQAYAEAQPQEPGEEEDTFIPPVSMTSVAPFLGPVVGTAAVSRVRALKAPTKQTNDSGLVLSKTATAKDDGSYTIRMEAYATGSSVTTTTTKDVPTDIVLVLDSSGSMGYCMVCGEEEKGHSGTVTSYGPVYDIVKTGKYYYKNSNGEYYPAHYCSGYTSTTGLFDNCEAGWYTESHNSSHRIGSRGRKLTPKTSEGSGGDQFYTKTTTTHAFQSRMVAIKSAATSFVTQVASKAQGTDGKTIDHRIAVVEYASGGIFDSGNSWILTNQNGNYFVNMKDTKGASTVNAAINSLEPGGATRVDSGIAKANDIFKKNPIPIGEQRNRVVIVFTDGAPTASNGFERDVAIDAISYADTAKNTYQATVYAVGIFSGADATSAGTQPSGDLDNDSSQLPAACNWFMQNVSSNNGTVQTPSYYLSAGDSTSLNNIFEQIASNIETGGSHSTLAESAVIKDVVTPYFTMPANTSKITVKTADSNGSASSWTNETVLTNASVNIENNTVSVSGFNFSENWCGAHTENGTETFHDGKKLIIEFTVTPKAGFLGGNNVPTNGEASGVYESATATTPIHAFDVPTVNVPIPDVTVTATDKNVYLTKNPTNDQLKEDVTIKCGNVDITDTTKLEEWQKAFVEFDTKVEKSDGFNATADGTYTVTATVSPSGKPATGTNVGTCTEKTNSDTKNINVFTPTLTWQDSTIILGETADYKDNKPTDDHLGWKHGTSTASDVTMTGIAPELTYTYDCAAGAFETDTLVTVTVKIGGIDVTEYVTFAHNPCEKDSDCQWERIEVDPHFIVHVTPCELTITKSGAETIDENQSFVFTVTGPDNLSLQVVIHGNNSVKVQGLKAGTYTVTEDTNWSWRYTPTENGKTVTLGETENSVTGNVSFGNTRKKDKWLNGGTYCDNCWTTTPATN